MSLLPIPHSVMSHRELDMVTAGVFTPWKLTNATNWGLVYSFVDCLDEGLATFSVKVQVVNAGLRSLSQRLLCRGHRQSIMNEQGCVPK